MKLTPWFEPPTCPVRPGVYEIRTITGTKLYRKWDGKKWYIGMPTVYTASRSAEVASWYRAWRGLATKDGK